MSTQCFISVRDVQQIKLRDGYQIVVTTDIPCHLWMRWSIIKPQRHSQPRLRRGIALHTDVYLCFVAYHDNEQEEAGDTLIHTFLKTAWPHCETRYFHFWGSVAGNTCRSTTALFKKHFTAPETIAFYPCWHNRIVRSNHGTWSIARSGVSETKFGWYQRPLSVQRVETFLVATYQIYRSFEKFHTQDTPAGKSVIAARLGLYVTDKTGITGTIHVTKGLWDEPVVEDDFGLQTNETTSLGSINLADLVLNAYNWIELNQAGIDWINQRPTEINQHESYDWRMTAYNLIYDAWQWGQNFTPQTDHTLTSLKLRLKRVGDPGNVYFDIRNTTPAGCPGDELLSQKMRPGIFISTDIWGDWFEVILDTPVNLVAGTTYAIKIFAPDGNATNRIEWIGSTGTPYQNGHPCFSDDSGASWDPRLTTGCQFIEYSAELVGGTKFCLRTDYDRGDVPPPPGAPHKVEYHSAQKGPGFRSLLELTFD